MTAPQRSNKMAAELFGLVETKAGYAHISDGLGNYTDMQLLAVAERFARSSRRMCRNRQARPFYQPTETVGSSHVRASTSREERRG